jgi:small subunit ribosomal protein S17
MPRKKEEEIAGSTAEAPETEAVETQTTETVEAAAPDAPVTKKASKETKAKADTPAETVTDTKGSKRAERVGIVSSDKMTKTVVVRVDRLVKHPVYRKYVKKRKKFMAHDELGAKIGDKVKIQETRPMSARKRWRVIEIIQKAEL